MPGAYARSFTGLAWSMTVPVDDVPRGYQLRPRCWMTMFWSASEIGLHGSTVPHASRQRQTPCVTGAHSRGHDHHVGSCGRRVGAGTRDDPVSDHDTGQRTVAPRRASDQRTGRGHCWERSPGRVPGWKSARQQCRSTGRAGRGGGRGVPGPVQGSDPRAYRLGPAGVPVLVRRAWPGPARSGAGGPGAGRGVRAVDAGVSSFPAVHGLAAGVRGGRVLPHRRH